MPWIDISIVTVGEGQQTCPFTPSLSLHVRDLPGKGEVRARIWSAFRHGNRYISEGFATGVWRVLLSLSGRKGEKVFIDRYRCPKGAVSPPHLHLFCKFTKTIVFPSPVSLPIFGSVPTVPPFSPYRPLQRSMHRVRFTSWDYSVKLILFIWDLCCSYKTFEIH